MLHSLLDATPVVRLRTRLDALRTRLRGGARAVPPPRAQLGGALDAVNDGFHDEYARARAVAHREAPVFILLADSLVVLRGDERTAYDFSPRAFHVLKSLAHVPIAIYASLESAAHAGTTDTLRRLAALRVQIVESQAALASETGLPPPARADCNALLDASLAYLDRGAPTGQREAFAAALREPLLRLLRAATALQLEALHAHVQAALAPLSADERAALHVVVTGDHQARVRSIGMQYFRKLLGEPDDHERRVTYAEGVADEQSALALVGTRRLDRALAKAFFGEERRLQRDLLGDAAQDLLQSFALDVIAERARAAPGTAAHAPDSS